MGKDVLCGWKEIEEFIGLKKESIVAKGFPIRKKGKTVMAMKCEILQFISALPIVRYKPTKNDNKRQ